MSKYTDTRRHKEQEALSIELLVVAHQVVITEDFPVALELIVLRLDMPHAVESEASCLHGLATLTKPVLQ